MTHRVRRCAAASSCGLQERLLLRKSEGSCVGFWNAPPKSSRRHRPQATSSPCLFLLLFRKMQHAELPASRRRLESFVPMFEAPPCWRGRTPRLEPHPQKICSYGPTATKCFGWAGLWSLWKKENDGDQPRFVSFSCEFEKRREGIQDTRSMLNGRAGPRSARERTRKK